MDGRNDNLSFIDILTVFSVMLQMQNYQADLKSASNDDLMRELQKQDREYFEQILSNQNKILRILSRFDDMSADQQYYNK